MHSANGSAARKPASDLDRTLAAIEKMLPILEKVAAPEFERLVMSSLSTTSPVGVSYAALFRQAREALAAAQAVLPPAEDMPAILA